MQITSLLSIALLAAGVLAAPIAPALKNPVVPDVGGAVARRAPKVHAGAQLTFYDPGMGACGVQSSASELVAALPHALFDARTPAGNPNRNPLCGRRIRVQLGDRSVTVKAVDRCPACEGNSLDLSRPAFLMLGEEAQGRLHGAKWTWVDA